ncbi:MAG: tRNA lysidine(34) synthetase TilS [Actinomycetaceae bacterium]|nr:tRNA lysidine(34) synthetase TilS [Actinomycetaceae bacterium]
MRRNLLAAFGSTPRASLREVSLACKQALQPLREYAWMCACSGGADSLALTLAAAELATRWEIPLHAVVIDHALRPQSAAEAQAAKEELAKWEVEATIVVADRGRSENSGGIEAHARELRYRALTDFAHQWRQQTQRPVAMLLGHTMDDQAETVLLGLAHGAGARALAGMEAVSVRDDLMWVRPLLGVRRADTSAAVKQLGANVVEDPTNAEDGPWRQANGQPLARIAVRHRVLPALAEALGRDPVPALARTASHLQVDNADLDTRARQVLEQARYQPRADASDAGKQAHYYRVQTLADTTTAVRRRALVQLAQHHTNKRIHHRQIEDLENLVINYRGQGPVWLAGATSAQRVHKGETVLVKVVSAPATVTN